VQAGDGKCTGVCYSGGGVVLLDLQEGVQLQVWCNMGIGMAPSWEGHLCAVQYRPHLHSLQPPAQEQFIAPSV
jgi:hypothetical protein